MAKVYRAQESGEAVAPVYVIRDGRFYRTINHPAGWSDAAEYEIRRDGKVYLLNEEDGTTDQTAVYEFKDIMLYRTEAHPDGAKTQPDYYIMD